MSRMFIDAGQSHETRYICQSADVDRKEERFSK